MDKRQLVTNLKKYNLDENSSDRFIKKVLKSCVNNNFSHNSDHLYQKVYKELFFGASHIPSWIPNMVKLICECYYDKVLSLDDFSSSSESSETELDIKDSQLSKDLVDENSSSDDESSGDEGSYEYSYEYITDNSSDSMNDGSSSSYEYTYSYDIDDSSNSYEEPSVEDKILISSSLSEKSEELEKLSISDTESYYESDTEEFDGQAEDSELIVPNKTYHNSSDKNDFIVYPKEKKPFFSKLDPLAIIKAVDPDFKIPTKNDGATQNLKYNLVIRSIQRLIILGNIDGLNDQEVIEYCQETYEDFKDIIYDSIAQFTIECDDSYDKKRFLKKLTNYQIIILVIFLEN